MFVNFRWFSMLAGCILLSSCQTPHIIHSVHPNRTEVQGYESWHPFEQGQRWGFKDRKGKIMLPARFRTVTEFNRRGLAAVLDEAGWVLIDSKGKEVIRPYMVDNGPDYFSEGLARFVRDRKFGYFDESGRVVIQPQFDFAYPFQNGKAKVGWGCTWIDAGEHQRVVGGEWKDIDHTGKILH